MAMAMDGRPLRTLTTEELEAERKRIREVIAELNQEIEATKEDKRGFVRDDAEIARELHRRYQCERKKLEQWNRDVASLNEGRA
jgi:chromosome segregation ATPase